MPVGVLDAQLIQARFQPRARIAQMADLGFEAADFGIGREHFGLRRMQDIRRRIMALAGMLDTRLDFAQLRRLRLDAIDGFIQADAGIGARRALRLLSPTLVRPRRRIGECLGQHERMAGEHGGGKEGGPGAHFVASWTFDALTHDMNALTASADDQAKLQALTDVIAGGLGGDAHVLLQVTAFVRIGNGQEVFPSQELILDKSGSKKSKTLYAVDDAAAIHSQKIGNAIRTIDTWYPEARENGPIAVEPYGSVTTQGKAYRQPKEKADFYNLLDGWVIKDKALTPEEQHFVIATLIRGGVFGDADK